MLASPLVGVLARRAGDRRRGGARGRARSVVGAARSGFAARCAGGSTIARGWLRSRPGSRSERAAMARCGVEELIERALRSSGYDLAMLAMPGGPRRLANVRKLMRLGARARGAWPGPDLRGFLELVHRPGARAAGDPRESEAPVEGEALDAVRLMTIHRAKGLEFPVVCVADLGRVAVAQRRRCCGSGATGGSAMRLARPGSGGREYALDYGALRDEQLEAEASGGAAAVLRRDDARRRSGWSSAARSTSSRWPTGCRRPSRWRGWRRRSCPVSVAEAAAVGGAVVERDGADGGGGVRAPGSEDWRTASRPPCGPRSRVQLHSRRPAVPPAPPVPRRSSPGPPVSRLSYSSARRLRALRVSVLPRAGAAAARRRRPLIPAAGAGRPPGLERDRPRHDRRTRCSSGSTSAGPPSRRGRDRRRCGARASTRRPRGGGRDRGR